MAEAFLFNIAENLLGKLSSLVLQEFFVAWGLESDLEKLKEMLSSIKAVLLDADQQQQAQDQKMQLWLAKLKEVFYDAEDVLDEFECDALRRQVLKQRSTSRKVRRFFSSSNPLAFRLRIGHQIKNIRKRLAGISSLKSNFDLTNGVGDRHVVRKDREMTHSFVHAADVIGRDEDKENVAKVVLQSGNGENVSVIAIVGIGGLGKSTLAKLVYNDRRVDDCFQVKMWVCVSEDFDTKTLVEKIIKSATGGIRFGENYGNLEMDQLQRVLREKIGGKKFLLVLDDVWNDSRTKWKELKDLLRVGSKGSKVLVTTRNHQVASVMGAISSCSLSGLPEDECLSLLLQCAFPEGQEKQYPNLVRIGKEIVAKCGGVPLAVITLGSLLFSTTEERDWKFIRDSDVWKLEQKENDILPALRLSYEHLPSYLKRCFAYCSIFPKDYEFIDWEVVYFWMAHGLLHSSNENQELEEIGFRYLKELMHRCFFQDIEDNIPYATFKMNDLIHDLALSVAQDECSMVTTSSQHIFKSVRHLSLPNLESLLQDFPLFLHNLNHARVRTISILSEDGFHGSGSIDETNLLKFQYLRSVNLSNSKLEVLPKRINTLKHLRHLDLSWNENLRKLPNSICELQNLQMLMVAGCEIEELPRDIRYMIGLRWLMITTKQKCLPNGGIGCLKSLRFLGLFRCKNLEYLCEDIQGLKSLRTLVIFDCRRLISLPQNMQCLTALETLAITDCNNLDLTMEESQHNQGPSRFGLKKLRIMGLPTLVDFPQWLLQGSTNTLQSLKIESCSSLRELPEWFKNLAALQHLQINGCHQVSKRCEQEKGEDWPKIAHIPKIVVDNANIKATNN